MLTTEIQDGLQIERITQGMCHHDSFYLITISRLQLSCINIAFGNIHIDENRNGTILQNGRNCCRKTCSNRYNLVTSLDLSLTQFRSRKYRECQQVCRRPWITKTAMLNTQPCRKMFLKPMRPRARCKPKIKRSINQIHHLGVVKIASTIIDSCLTRNKRRPFCMHLFIILFCKL